jgi:preprotein translocase subunit YajC
MYSFVLPLLPVLMGQAQGAEAGKGGAMGGILSFLPFILIIAIFYFLIIRPQNKKQKETKKMLDALKKGDKVVTIGGINGVITKVGETTVTVQVDDSTKIKFTRSAIAQITEVAKSKDDDDDDEDEKESKSDKKTDKKSDDKKIDDKKSDDKKYDSKSDDKTDYWK